METSIITAAKDLNQLVDLATAINKDHEEVGTALRRGLEHARKAGDSLLIAKTQVVHGQWEQWVKDNLKCSKRTAETYMTIARNWDVLKSKVQQKAQDLADIGLERALKVLAKPKTNVQSETVQSQCRRDAAHESPQLNETPSIAILSDLSDVSDTKPSLGTDFTPTIYQDEQTSSEIGLDLFADELTDVLKALNALADRAAQLDFDNEGLKKIASLVFEVDSSFARLQRIVKRTCNRDLEVPWSK